jgi:lipoate-protein ligase A
MIDEKIIAEINRLKEHRAKLQEVIKALSAEINALERKSGKYYHYTPKEWEAGKTISEKMFGKRLKDLTPDEYREYYRARQRERRKKQKEDGKQ